MKVSLVALKIRQCFEHGLEHLIGGNDVIKAHQRNGIADTRVMRIEGHDIGNAHCLQLLQCYSAVERLAVVAAVLSAAVEDRHDDVDSVCLAGCCLNDALEILEMIVRAHGILHAEVVIGHAVVAHVGDDEQILAADGLLDHALAVTGGETRALTLYEEGIGLETALVCPFHEIIIDLVSKLGGTVHSNQAQRCDIGLVVKQNFIIRTHTFSPSGAARGFLP